MIVNLLIAVHVISICMLTFLSVDMILLLRYVNWSTFRSLSFNETLLPGTVETPTAPLQWSKNFPYPQWGLLEDRILVAKQSLTWVISGHMTCNTQLLLLLGLDGQSKRPDLINQLVKLTSSIYMMKSRLYSINCSNGKQPQSVISARRQSLKVTINKKLSLSVY